MEDDDASSYDILVWFKSDFPLENIFKKFVFVCFLPDLDELGGSYWVPTVLVDGNSWIPTSLNVGEGVWVYISVVIGLPLI